MMQLSEWTSLKVPPMCEQVLGFSIPHDGSVLVVTYDYMCLLHLGQSLTLERDDTVHEYDAHDPEIGTAVFRNQTWNILGLHEGDPLLRSPQGETLRITDHFLEVTKPGTASLHLVAENPSGDWEVATFSPDGQFIVLGCPHDSDFRVWHRVPTAEH